ncbi:ribosome silencing factor [Rothia sp. CCM 9418]|uniref:ribosome silencing factor n=1 Tax=unclassified Rothia (in: high G+C Gram-positive bacteria) TaxID=2689056 RepID=UPI003ACD6109
MTASPRSVEALKIAAQAAEDKQGTNLFAVDTAERMGLIDGFLVVSAHNERLVNAIVDAVEDDLREKMDMKPTRREGRSGGRWVLLDFEDIVIHVQHEEDRAFYALDRLWSDAPRIPLGLESEAPALEEVDQEKDQQMIREDEL